jgi:hypothetical protein
MLNHAPERQGSVAKKWNRGVVPSLETQALRPFTNYLGVSFEAQSTLKPGSEVTFSYGNEAYFKERHVPFNFRDSDYVVSLDKKTPTYSLEELERVGHCLTDIYVNKSTIPMAGKGVFSSKAHDAGSTLSISPVLVVPKHVLEKAGRSSVLMNFCFSDQGTDLALLPLGTAALMNHGAEPNVAVRWYSWSEQEQQQEQEGVQSKSKSAAKEILSGNLTTLLRASAAPLYFEYYSLRPIAADEELVLDYGRQWEAAWAQYANVAKKWAEVYKDKGDLMSAPQFRHTLSLPPDMLPASVYNVSCFGTRDCEEYFHIRQPKYLHQKLNDEASIAHTFDLSHVNYAKISFSAAQQGSRSDTQEEIEVSAEDGTPPPPTSLQVEDSTCSLYLAPIAGNSGGGGSGGGGGGGMGVFGGVKFQRGDVLDISPALLVSTQTMSALRHIGAPAMREHYFSVLFGPGAAVRSSSRPNIDRTYDAQDRLRSIPSPQAQATRPYNIHTNMLYYASDTISEGEELTVFSGESTKDTDMQAKPLRAKYSVKELEKVGHCLSDIYVDKSAIPMAGNGVFSKKSHLVGSLVSISAASVVPRHLLEEEASSVLINSCLSDDSTDICVLPLGLAASINHGAEPNIALRWYQPPSRPPSGSGSAEEFLGGHLQALLRGEVPLYLEYYAVRPIAAGDELTMSYGNAWADAWMRYLSVLAMWMGDSVDVNSTRDGDSDRHGNMSSQSVGYDDSAIMNAPQFRQFITLPAGLLPAASYRHPSCLGDIGCSGASKLRRPFRIEANLNRDAHSRSIFTKWIDQSKKMVEEKREGEHGENDKGVGDSSSGISGSESIWTLIYKSLFA